MRTRYSRYFGLTCVLAAAACLWGVSAMVSAKPIDSGGSGAKLAAPIAGVKPVASAAAGSVSAAGKPVEPKPEGDAGGASQTPSVWYEPLRLKFSKALDSIDKWGGAFVIGGAGSGAFFFGVWLGFISPGSRRDILQHLVRMKPLKPVRQAGQNDIDYLTEYGEWVQNCASVDEGVNWYRALAFFAFGGIVSLVFQLADLTQLVPIQAFVLGATWPSVVTRVMAGGSNDNSPRPPGPDADRPGLPSLPKAPLPPPPIAGDIQRRPVGEVKPPQDDADKG